MIYNSATHALINRPEYLNQLIEHKDVDLVKIVTGIRRCGKSSLLDLFHKHLLNSGINEDHIIHINLESLKYRAITNYMELYDYISKRMPADRTENGAPCIVSQNAGKFTSASKSINAGKSTKTYLIFDELQAVENWQKAVESFRIDFNVDIYITGSNAYLLSSEFSTLLAGRYVEIRMLPLSFKEFLSFYNFPTSTSTDEKFQKYVQFGGMPVLSEYKFNEARSMQALEGIYSTVILRDVLQRNKNADQIVLQKLMSFLCSTIGSTTSPNSISKSLRAEGDIEKTTVSVASKTVSDYIRMLKDAFIVFPVQRYDVQGKELLKTLGKNYVIDLGFRNMLLGYRGTDRGHIIENVVFLELIRRDYRVYIGKVGNAEVDFVAEKPNEKIYVQVTESMQSPETRERELKPLRAIKDNYEKIVISMDRDYINSYDGIKAINLTDWLLS